MAARSDIRRAFLERSGWGDAVASPLAGDASFRSYQRLRRGSGVAVLMDAPPPHEDVRPFIVIAEKLAALGLSAPRIIAADAEHGFLLIEDFGDDTYTRLLANGADEHQLYALATDALAALHAWPAQKALPAGVPDYRSPQMLDTAQLLLDWSYPEVWHEPPPADLIAEFRTILAKPLAFLDAQPQTLVLRDFHVDNLMLLAGRAGVKACGLLDFQDAARGAKAYDLISLLEDARRDIAPALRAAMIERYLSATGAPRGDFLAACAIAAAQRHCRIAGQFVRLHRRDGKPAYLRHLPRVWRLLERALEHDMLADMKRLIDRALPAGRRLAPP